MGFKPGSTKTKAEAGFELGTFQSPDDHFTVTLRLLFNHFLATTATPPPVNFKKKEVQGFFPKSLYKFWDLMSKILSSMKVDQIPSRQRKELFKPAFDFYLHLTKLRFYVMASGGLYFFIYNTIHSPYKSSLCIRINI